MSLNFFTATQAHQRWKKRLMDCVCGECTENLSPELIALDNRCDLGRWLHKIKSSQPVLTRDTMDLFSRLLDEHAQFHRSAGEVARLVLQGDKAKALSMLQGGDYMRVSNMVIGRLGELYLKRREFGMP